MIFCDIFAYNTILNFVVLLEAIIHESSGGVCQFSL